MNTTAVLEAPTYMTETHRINGRNVTGGIHLIPAGTRVYVTNLYANGTAKVRVIGNTITKVIPVDHLSLEDGE